MTTDVRELLKEFIYCLFKTGRGRVPRPYSPVFHGTNVNDLLQFYYIEIPASIDGKNHVLLLRDDHLDYKWICAFSDTSAENEAKEIIDWYATFKVPKSLMSYAPTHLKNKTISRLEKRLKARLHLTLPYTPWSNGAVERLGNEFFRTFKAINSELGARPYERIDLIPIVQTH